MNKRLPEDSHWWFASRTRALQSLVDPLVSAKRYSLDRPLEVLDVGCGAGNMAHHLAEYGNVIGFDFFANPLQVAVERGCRVVQADAGNLPFPDGRFDLVAALDVIEHCEDDHRVVAELYRILAPGGLLAITVPAFEWLWSYNDDLNHHKRRYTAGRLRSVLEGAGFRIRRIGFNNFFILPVAAAMIAARGRRPPGKLSAPSTDGGYQVEMQPASPPVNAVLERVGKVEAGLIEHVDLPIGTGILTVAERPR